MAVEKSESRHDERVAHRRPEELEQPIVPRTWELPSGTMSANEIISRGQMAERSRGMQNLDNAKLAENNVSRDVWRDHVPPVIDGGVWELIAYKNLGGVGARFTVSRRLKDGPQYDARILIISASGLLVDCQVVGPEMVDRFVDETIRYTSYQGRMR